MKTIWLFPGQGSQAVGMGVDLQVHTAAKALFDQASEILGWSVIERCQGDEATLSRTLYTQPCLYVVESALAQVMADQGLQPDFVAGHSLGEYSALQVAGVFSFTDGLRLIQRRAQLMDSASDGMMAALLGFDRSQLEQALQDTPDVVLANDNNAGQVVISGAPAAVEAIISSVKSKRAVKLNVSGAFHSPLMADAAKEFQRSLDQVPFQTAKVPVLSNVDPTPATDAAALKHRLSRQMTGTVRWREISLALPELGVEQAIEVGPGNVLGGIMKRTCSSVNFLTVGSLPDLKTVAVAQE